MCVRGRRERGRGDGGKAPIAPRVPRALWPPRSDIFGASAERSETERAAGDRDAPPSKRMRANTAHAFLMRPRGPARNSSDLGVVSKLWVEGLGLEGFGYVQ